MTLDEIADEAVDVLAALERLGAHLEPDADGPHIFTPPAVPDLGDLALRLPGVLAALAVVVVAEEYVRAVQS